MAKTKIDLEQLDEFDNQVYEQITDGQIIVWDDTNKEFKPENKPSIEGDDEDYKKIFMLMGA